MNRNFNIREELPGKVKVIRFVDGIPVSDETKEYFENKPKSKPLDCIKKLTNKQKKRLEKAKKYKKGSGKEFYKSREWLELRYRVLRVYKAKCMCCGRTPQNHGIFIHVDHIKPRSKYPELELDFDNMQVLCAACNCGKSNLDNTDWRALTNNDIYLIKQSQKMG